MVQILMSTYNGEKYIEEQINSLLNQTYQNIEILIRDDGSIDKTIEILKKYEAKFPSKIKCIYGANIGVIKSFFELVNQADKKIEYFAFCDQDDFWLENKIEKAIQYINKKKPSLYFSNKIIVNEKLEILKEEKKLIEPSLNNSLVENLATGCTILINKKLMDFLKNKKIEFSNIIMHDWYIYILANLIGDVNFDQNAYIYYRQHSNNVVGNQVNFFKKYKKKIKTFLIQKDKKMLKKQALEIIEIYKEQIPIEKYNEVKKIFFTTSMSERHKNLKKFKLKRQGKIDDVIFKCLYVIGWI